MNDNLENIELQDFIKSALQQIEIGADVRKRSFKDAIEFEASVSKTEKLQGNVKIYVAQGGGEISKESIAKIKFQVYPNYPKDDTSHLIDRNSNNLSI